LPLWWTDDGGTCTCPAGQACPSAGKHPLTANGLKDASTDERQIIAWWTTWPIANIGARTDRLHRFDIDLVDVAQALMADPTTALVTNAIRTIRPGLHLEFVTTEPLQTRTLYLADGRRLGELRGLEAYVVVPPSRVGTAIYCRLSRDDVAPIHLDDPLDWLARLLAEFGFELEASPPRRDYEKLGGRIFEGEGRHTGLTSYAGLIWIEGLSADGFVGALSAINQAQCSPPLPEKELRAIAEHFIVKRKQRAVTLSAATNDAVPAERNIRFRTAKELAEQAPDQVVWIAKPWIAAGALTELDGKVKSSGKTTLLTHLVRCVLDGVPFMGQPTMKTEVVYLTEQPDSSFTQALRRAGLLGREDLHVLSWKDTRGSTWEEVAGAAVAKCVEVGALLLIVDTLPQFAGLEGEGENSSGAALQAIQPLQFAAGTHGIGVCAARHERKSGGEVGDSGRGSSAFAGAADVVLSLRRPEGNAASNIRVIRAIGRFDDVPESLAIELTEEGYRALGTEDALGMHRAREKLADALSGHEQFALTIDELMDKTKLGRSVIQEALKAMIDDDEVARSGRGVKGDPYRYYLK
jgi:hypothetical protein